MQPVIDLNQGAAVDAYEIPAKLREAVHLIHPGDTFPFAANLSRKVDLDHQVPYAEGGKTSTDNLGPMTRTHHRIKTHAGWQVRQPFPRDRHLARPTRGGPLPGRPDRNTQGHRRHG